MGFLGNLFESDNQKKINEAKIKLHKTQLIKEKLKIIAIILDIIAALFAIIITILNIFGSKDLNDVSVKVTDNVVIDFEINEQTTTITTEEK